MILRTALPASNQQLGLTKLRVRFCDPVHRQKLFRDCDLSRSDQNQSNSRNERFATTRLHVTWDKYGHMVSAVYIGNAIPGNDSFSTIHSTMMLGLAFSFCGFEPPNKGRLLALTANAIHRCVDAVSRATSFSATRAWFLSFWIKIDIIHQ